MALSHGTKTLPIFVPKGRKSGQSRSLRTPLGLKVCFCGHGLRARGRHLLPLSQRQGAQGGADGRVAA